MHKYRLGVFLFVVCIVLIDCKDNNFNFKPKDVEKPNTPLQLDIEFDDGSATNVGRAIWQKPGLVIEKLGDVSDKVIVDLGAGTGYFAFKLALRAKKVIAVEIEPELVKYIDSTKIKLPVDRRENLEGRLATANDPNLREGEADIILIINTITYIDNLRSYLQKLKKGLKVGGSLMIIDYKMKKLPINAPPRSERMYLDKLEDILLEAGYKVTLTDDTSLDFQYLIQAIKI